MLQLYVNAVQQTNRVKNVLFKKIKTITFSV
jgi:hypothetical protein